MTSQFCIALKAITERLVEMPTASWYVVAEIEGREGVYGVEETSAHSILAELAGRGVFLVSPWRDVAIDVAAKLNGQAPDDLVPEQVGQTPKDGGDTPCE